MVIKVFTTVAEYQRAKKNCPSKSSKLLGNTVDMVCIRRSEIRTQVYVVEAKESAQRFKGFKELDELKTIYPEAKIE